MQTKFSGSALRLAREKTGLSEIEVRRAMVAAGHKLSTDQLRLWERDEVAPGAVKIAALATVLGCDPGDFFIEVASREAA